MANPIPIKHKGTFQGKLQEHSVTEWARLLDKSNSFVSAHLKIHEDKEFPIDHIIEYMKTHTRKVHRSISDKGPSHRELFNRVILKSKK